MRYASGRHGYFVCDTCGFQYPYLERKESSYGTVVCPDCFDGDFDIKNHPQGKRLYRGPDAIFLRKPRPEQDFAVSFEPLDDEATFPIAPGGGNVLEG